MIDPISKPWITFWDKILKRDTLKERIFELEVEIAAMENAIMWSGHILFNKTDGSGTNKYCLIKEGPKC